MNEDQLRQEIEHQLKYSGLVAFSAESGGKKYRYLDVGAEDFVKGTARQLTDLAVRFAVQELVDVRSVYDRMEDAEEPHTDIERWKHWKGVRNVITDRIEALTGFRAGATLGEPEKKGSPQ